MTLAPSGLSQPDRELIDRFEAAYNTVDRFLRHSLRQDSGVPFQEVVRQASRLRSIRSSERELLRRIGELRNVVVHTKIVPNGYIAVPTLDIVRSLEAIRDRLARPVMAIPLFQKAVEALQPNDTLVHALRAVRKRDFSQFPVYEKGRFLGLLTENGITRWLALHLERDDSLIELADIPVSRVLHEEKNTKQNCVFARRQISSLEVRELFASRELLEAVIFTDKGLANEQPLGIATRWDIARGRLG
jgi:predicted transcriptional regulator